MNLKILLLFLLGLSCDGCASIVDVLLDFKERQSDIIARNDLVAIKEVGELTKKAIRTNSKQNKADLIGKMRAKALSPLWLEWFTRRFATKDQIGSKELVAAVFYPHEVAVVTHKEHLSQMPYAFKMCIYYSSEFDENGAGRETINSLRKVDWQITPPETLLEKLDNPFVSHNTLFIEQSCLLLSSGNDLAIDGGGGGGSGGSAAGTSLDQFVHLVEAQGSPMQKYNASVLIKRCGRADAARRLLEAAAAGGSVRARLDMAYIVMQERGHTAGEGDLRALGSYGIWKIAQCYRYGRQVPRDLKVANAHYLDVLKEKDTDRFPEIFYDAGEFATDLAFGQKDPELFERTLAVAIAHFKRAGESHISSGYIQVAELITKATTLFPQLKEKPEFTDALVLTTLRQGTMEGAYGKVRHFLTKLGKDPSRDVLLADAVELMGFIECVDRELGK